MSYSGGKQHPPQNRHHQRNHAQRYIQQGYQYDHKLDYGGNGMPDGRGVPQHHPQHHPQHPQQHPQQQGRYGVPPGRGYGPPPGPEQQQQQQQQVQMGGYHPGMLYPQHYRAPTPDAAKPGLELLGLPGGAVYPGQQQQQQVLQRPALHPASYGLRRPGPAVMAGRPPAPYPGHDPSLPPPPPPHAAYTTAAGPPANPQAGLMLMPLSHELVSGASPANPAAAVQMRQPYMTQSVYQPQPAFSLPQQPLYGQPMWRPPQPQLPQQLLEQQLALQRSQQLEALSEQQQRQQQQLPPPPQVVMAVQPPPQQQHQTTTQRRNKRMPIIDPGTGLEVSPSPDTTPPELGPGPGEPAWRPPGAPAPVVGGGDGPWHPSPGSGIPGRRHRPHSSASTSEMVEPERRPTPAARQRTSASTSELDPSVLEPVLCIPGVARPVVSSSGLASVLPPTAAAVVLPVATVMPVSSAPPPPPPQSLITAVGEFQMVSAADVEASGVSGVSAEVSPELALTSGADAAVPEPAAAAEELRTPAPVPTRPVAVVEPLVPETPAEEPASPPAEKLEPLSEPVGKSTASESVVVPAEPVCEQESSTVSQMEGSSEATSPPPVSETDSILSLPTGDSTSAAAPAAAASGGSSAACSELASPERELDTPTGNAVVVAVVTDGSGEESSDSVVVSSDQTGDETAAETSDETAAGLVNGTDVCMVAGSEDSVKKPSETVVDSGVQRNGDDGVEKSCPSPAPALGDAENSTYQAAAAAVVSAPPPVISKAPSPDTLSSSSSGGSSLSAMPSQGKTQYCREELLRLQHAPLSQRRPESLPDLPSVVRRGGASNTATAAANLAAFKARAAVGSAEFSSGFKPAVMGPPGKYRGRNSGPAGGLGMGGRNMGPPLALPPRRIEISLKRDVKLHTAENAWKPAAAAADQLDPAEKVVRSLKGILNKLTPSNLERQVDHMKQLELNTPALLASMIDVLFEKAVVEPTYATQYAAVCLAMAKTEVETDPGEGKAKVTFKRLLLQQCQREFEKDKSGELNREQRLKEISQLTDESARRLQTHLLSQEARKMRHRSNGTIRFIGEIYKLGMLTDKIMHQCICKLFKDKHEDSYECLCKLVTTIGDKLERSEKAHGMDLMFTDFKKLTRDKSISSRIRFMILDLIELRGNHWVDVRTAGKTKPQTIDEVHKQAAQAEVAQQAALSNHADRRGGDRRGGRPLPPRGNDGWSNPAGRSHFDPGRVMSALQGGAAPPSAGAPLKLGPAGAGGWSLGSKASRPSPSVSPAAGPPLANRFAALRGGERGASSRGSSRDRSGSRPGSRPGSRSGSRHSSAERPAVSRLMGSATATADQMRRQARTIISEFKEVGNVEAAIEDCEAHLHEATVGTFVAEGLEAFVDASSAAARTAAGRLHLLLLERRLVTPAQYLRAVSGLLDAAPDLAIDIPAVWQNLAQMVAPVIMAGKVSLHDVACVTGESAGSGGGRRFVVALLSEAGGDEEQLRRVAPPDTEWTRFLGAEDCGDVLQQAGFGFLLPSGAADLSLERAPEEAGLRALVTAVRGGDGHLAAWLDRQVAPELRRHAQFTADLIAAIGFYCLVVERGVMTARPERMLPHAEVLRAQLDCPERQATAAGGLARLAAHLTTPPGVLEQLLRQLQTMQLLPAAALRCWRDQLRRQQLSEPAALRTLLSDAA